MFVDFIYLCVGLSVGRLCFPQYFSAFNHGLKAMLERKLEVFLCWSFFEIQSLHIFHKNMNFDSSVQLN
jgi:hypothetical protein